MLYLTCRLIAFASAMAAVPIPFAFLPSELSAQEHSPVLLKDSYWTQTVADGLDAAEVTKLKISTSGTIRLSGQEQGRLEYILRKRARAGAQKEAERLLRTVGVRLEKTGSIYVLSVSPGGQDLLSHELEVRAPNRLAAAWLETFRGGIEVDGVDGAILAESGDGPVRVGRIGGSLTARTRAGDIEVGSVSGELRCVTGSGNIRAGRSGGEAWFDTGGGSIAVEEAAGPVHAVSGGGDIEVRRAGSSVTARTGGGLIRIQKASGPVNVQSAGGSIEIDAATGVRCQSASGGIRLRGVSGALNVSTSVGSILADLIAGTPIHDSFLNTSAGDIIVQIPSNLAVTVSAQNFSPGRHGRIISEFPEIAVRASAHSVGAPVVAEGALNGGGPVLKIAAAEGTIFLRRLK